jgi:hypothetical protein
MNKILMTVYAGIIMMAVGLIIGATGILSEMNNIAYYGAVLIFIGIVVVLAINTQYLIIFFKVKKRNEQPKEEPK